MKEYNDSMDVFTTRDVVIVNHKNQTQKIVVLHRNKWVLQLETYRIVG